jgi:hypothetical protein
VLIVDAAKPFTAWPITRSTTGSGTRNSDSRVRTVRRMSWFTHGAGGRPNSAHIAASSLAFALK